VFLRRTPILQAGTHNPIYIVLFTPIQFEANNVRAEDPGVRSHGHAIWNRASLMKLFGSDGGFQT